MRKSGTERGSGRNAKSQRRRSDETGVFAVQGTGNLPCNGDGAVGGHKAWRALDGKRSGKNLARFESGSLFRPALFRKKRGKDVRYHAPRRRVCLSKNRVANAAKFHLKNVVGGDKRGGGVCSRVDIKTPILKTNGFTTQYIVELAFSLARVRLCTLPSGKPRRLALLATPSV